MREHTTARDRSQSDAVSRHRSVGALALVLFATLLFTACTTAGGTTDSESAGGDTGGSAPSTRAVDAVPDFELTLFETANHSSGEVLRLSQLQGSPVVVNFWFPSCPPCRAEMPDLEASFQNHTGDGVEFIGVQQVGLDSVQEGQNFIGEIGTTYAVGADVDSSIIQEYKIVSYPTTLFLDRDHRVVKKWQGPLNEEKIEEFIQMLLQ